MAVVKMKCYLDSCLYFGHWFCNGQRIRYWKFKECWKTFCGKAKSLDVKLMLCSNVEIKVRLAFPNIWQYYQAALVEHLMQWWSPASQGSWGMEQLGIEITTK